MKIYGTNYVHELGVRKESFFYRFSRLIVSFYS